MKAATFTVAATMTLALSSAVDARPRKSAIAPECNITMPCEGVSAGNVNRMVARKAGRAVTETASAAYEYGVSRPIGFVGGRLNCARSVNAHLAAQGRSGSGAATAGSFASWGRPSGPVPGAVARYGCCGPTGHVAIVSHVDGGGQVWIWNPTRSGWKLVRQWRRPIEYRA